MKKIIEIIAVIVVIAAGYFLYSIRPVSAPTEPIQTATSDVQNNGEGNTVYQISQEGSKVEFDINEVLYGKPNLVVGTTNQVAGNAVITTASRLAIGPIKIAASTFVTDNTQRNGAIARLILHSDKKENQYIVFAPNSIDLKTATKLAKGATFNVAGELTISGVTKPALFTVNATTTKDTIVATAVTTLRRGNFNLVIPSIPFVANVDESFKISVTIVANKVNQ